MSKATALVASLALIAFPVVLAPLAAHAAEMDPAKAEAGTYKEDPVHTSLTVRIPHGGGLSNFTFRFDKVDITYVYDPAKPAATVITADVDPKSIDTACDKHLQDKDFNAEISGDRFLKSAQFPVISFKSTGIAYSGNTGKMTGNLTLMGVTKPVTLDVTYNGSSGQGNRARMGFSARGVIKRSDFGFTAMIGPLGDDVTFQIETELAKQ